jgi:hypothetical protein
MAAFVYGKRHLAGALNEQDLDCCYYCWPL